MSSHRRVVWSEGMLLSPQHLQQWDRSTHHLLDDRLRALQPLSWGFTRLEVDRDALRNDRFGVNGAQGVLPDGTPFSIPEVDAPPGPRAISQHFDSRQEKLTVCLGVPSSRVGRPQIGNAPAPGTTGPRHSPEAIELADDGDASSSRSVIVARKNFSILFPGDALDDHDLLPVAVLKRTSEGVFSLLEDFVPPCLSIGASEFLMGRLRSELEMLITKSDDLSAKRRVRGGVADFSVGDLTSFGTLLCVNAYIPVLSHTIAVGRAHPEHVYSLLASLAGQLCSFSASHSPKKLPRYDHRDPGAAFRELHASLAELLLIREDTRAVRIELVRQEDSIYVGRIEDPRLLEPAAELFLGARADLEKDRLLRDLPVNVKVASHDQINRIVEMALDGVSMKYAQDPPASLPLRPDYSYFRLLPTGDAWEGVRGAKNVAIFAPSGVLPGISLDLLGLRG